MPQLFFTWIQRADKRVHFEFLDNSVPFGERPRTVAFGWNDTLNVLDVKSLLDIDRYRRVNIDATSPEALYRDPLQLAPEHNAAFLRECVKRFPEVNFADAATGRIYVRISGGVPCGPMRMRCATPTLSRAPLLRPSRPFCSIAHHPRPVSLPSWRIRKDPHAWNVGRVWREQNAHRIGNGYAVHPNIRFAVFLIDVKDARRAKPVSGPQTLRTTRSISMSTRLSSTAPGSIRCIHARKRSKRRHMTRTINRPRFCAGWTITSARRPKNEWRPIQRLLELKRVRLEFPRQSPRYRSLRRPRFSLSVPLASVGPCGRGAISCAGSPDFPAPRRSAWRLGCREHRLPKARVQIILGTPVWRATADSPISLVDGMADRIKRSTPRPRSRRKLDTDSRSAVRPSRHVLG